jgi:hypothetical protein
MPLRTRDTTQPITEGQRFVVDVDLYDNRTSLPMDGLPQVDCQFLIPGRVLTELLTMTEDIDTPGRYRLTYVANEAGEWLARIIVPAPYESVFRIKFYVEHDNL